MLARPSSAIFKSASVVEAGAVPLKLSCIKRFFFKASGGFGSADVLPMVPDKGYVAF